MTIRLPTHAYVPSKTPRHPEGAFDDTRNTAADGMSPTELADTDAFRHGLAYLDAGYFWEAHEVLEPVWMVLPDGEERRFVQGLIQLANALLKERMGRGKAAMRLAQIARELIGEGSSVMGVARTDLRDRIDVLERSLAEN